MARTDRLATDDRDVKVSLQHGAAAALLLGAAGLEAFSAATVVRPDIAALRAKVHAALDPALPVGAARVVIETIEGATLQAEIIYERGSLQRPISDADLEAKLHGLATGSGCDAVGVIAAVWELDQAPGVQTLLRAAQPS